MGWLVPGMALLLALLVVGVFAWQRDDDVDAPTPTPELTPPTDAPFLILPVSGAQGAAGTVTLYGLGGQTLVILDLQGAGTQGAARLRDGACGGPSDRDEWLLVGVGENGTSRTLVDVPLGTLLAGTHVVDLPRAGVPAADEVCIDVIGVPVNGAGTPVDLDGGSVADSAGMAGDGTGGSAAGRPATPPVASPSATPPGSTPVPS